MRLSTLLPLAALVAVPVGILLARWQRGPAPELALEPATKLEFELIGNEDTLSVGELIRGRVTDMVGIPVPDAIVFTRRADRPLWTTTNAEGQFELAGADPAPWKLTAAAYGHLPQDFVIESSPTELRFGALWPASPRFEPIERSAFRGRLKPKLSSMRDLEGYEVSFLPLAGPEVFGGAVPRRVSVAADGSFELPDLTHAEYELAILPAWARGTRWPDLSEPSDRRCVHPQPEGAPPELALGCGEIRGRVTDAEGSFLEGAVVSIVDTEDANRIWPPAATDEEGAFLVRDLPEGSYEVTVRAGEGRQRTRATVNAGTTATFEFELVTHKSD